MNISSVEQAILGRLADTIEGLAIESFPNNPETYQLKHPLGAVLVRYDASAFSPAADTAGSWQTRAMSWEIMAVSRNLRNKGGLYDMLDAIRESLAGYEIDGERLMPKKDEFVNESAGIWSHRIVFDLPMPTPAIPDSDFESPTLKIARFFEGGIERVTVQETEE